MGAFGVDEPGFSGPHSYDIVVGKDDFLYVPDASSGLRVSRYTKPGMPQ